MSVVLIFIDIFLFLFFPVSAVGAFLKNMKNAFFSYRGYPEQLSGLVVLVVINLLIVAALGIGVPYALYLWVGYPRWVGWFIS